MRTRQNVIDKLREIANISSGWTDLEKGDEFVFDENNIEKFIVKFNEYYPDDLPMPLAVALFSGDIAFDWVIGEEIFILLDFDTHDTDLRSDLIQTNVSEDYNYKDTLYLTRKEHWDILIGRVQKALGDS